MRGIESQAMPSGTTACLQPRSPALSTSQAPSPLTAATIDHLLLSLAPVSTAAVASRAVTSMTRAHSDTTLGVCGPALQLNGSPPPDDNFTKKVRRRSVFATFGRRAPLHETTRDGFFDVFGALGIPMVFAFLFSGSAVLSQALVQVLPTEFANAFMGTTGLDSGEFWVLAETPAAPKVIATMLLVAFSLCYYLLAVLMLFLRHKLISPSSANQKKSKGRAEAVQPAKPLPESTKTREQPSGEDGDDDESSERAPKQLPTRRERFAASFAVLYGKFAHIDGPYHAYYVSYLYKSSAWHPAAHELTLMIRRTCSSTCPS